MKYNGVVQYEQEYGAFGQIGLLRDKKNGMEYRYEYDTAGRLLRSTGTPTSANGFATLDFTNTYHPTKGWLTAVKRVIDGVARQSTYTYKTNGQLEKETFADGGSVTYYPDALGRVNSTAYKHNTTALFDRNTVFSDDESGDNTTGRVLNDRLIATDWMDLYLYGYDANGNISTLMRQTSLDESATTSSYYYDSLNQLTAANHNGISYAYVYDYGGNITLKVVNGTVTAYTYGDSTWRDLLTGYGNETFTYDQIGNPLTWRNGAVFTWQGRQLQTATVNGKSLSYSYNADGIRTKKTVNGVTTYYVLDGSKVVSQKTGTNDPVYFEYDATGKPVSMSYLGMVFYYVTNMQGDVIALVNSSGDKVVEYTYDPWGKLLSTTGLYANDFGYLNPFRYRGYYYDNETGLYYLNSRYYDPEVGRFINADSYVSTGQGILGYNMFAYCNNNPIMYIDSTGKFAWWIFAILGGFAIIGAVAGALSNQKLAGLGQNNSKDSAESTEMPSLDSVSLSPSSVALANKPTKPTKPTKPAELGEPIQQPQELEELTVGDRVLNAAIGAAAGLLVGGAAVSSAGLIGSFVVGSGTIAIAGFGATGAQTFALGALAYNFVAMVVAPFLGIEIEPIEYEP